MVPERSANLQLAEEANLEGNNLLLDLHVLPLVGTELGQLPLFANTQLILVSERAVQ